MKRLLDTSDTDPLSARARVLLRALGPTLESEDRLRRVRRSLEAAGQRTTQRWAFRLTLAAALLGVSAAAAAAAGVFSKLSSDEAPAAAPQRLVRPQPAQPPPVALPRVAGEPPPRAASAQAPLPLVPATPQGTAPQPAERAVPSRLPSPSPSSDVACVHEAAKALRRDGDPARALQLLERSGAPISGPLAEEALALRIEASAAQGNGRASKLAAAYLARYPNGRYRELAKKAIAGREP